MRHRLPLAAATLALLVACGSGEPPPEFRVSSVLPAVLAPGERTTVFGKFPARPGVRLGDQPVAFETRRDALEIVVPRGMDAGEYTLAVTANGVTANASLTLEPRIDNLVLNGSRLEVEGVGWRTAAAEVWLGGRRYTAVRDGERLSVTVPGDLPYGDLAVRVVVGARSSATRSLVREAGRVGGRVLLPASGTAVAALNAPAVNAAATPSTTLLLEQPGANLERTRTVLEGVACRIRRSAAFPLTVVRCGDTSSTDQARARLEKNRVALEISRLRSDAAVGVEAASQGVVRPQSLEPNPEQWYLEREGIPAAWTATRGAGVVVAVVDTGVDLEHPDLRANLLPGWDFVDDDAIPQDTVGHGTHVAGLVAARGRVNGVAPEASMLPVRALPGLSGGSAIDVADAVLWSVDALPGRPNPHPAAVINLSLGSDSPSPELLGAIRVARARGALVVAAAGNNGGTLNYPAAWPEVIAVTALAGPALPYQPGYASRGPGVFVTAYGGDSTQDQDRDGVPDGILSTDVGEGGYGLRMGTSMAAPQVAGLLALGLARALPARSLTALLAGSAVDLGPGGYDLRFGHGLISGALALGRTPTTYAVARDARGRVLAASVVGEGLTFDLGNLPPGPPVTLAVAVDGDGDGRLAESGEPFASSPAVVVTAGTTTALAPLQLEIADGTRAFGLEDTP